MDNYDSVGGAGGLKWIIIHLFKLLPKFTRFKGSRSSFFICFLGQLRGGSAAADTQKPVGMNDHPQ